MNNKCVGKNLVRLVDKIQLISGFKKGHSTLAWEISWNATPSLIVWWERAVVPKPGAPAQQSQHHPKNDVGMCVLRPRPRLAQSETLGVGPSVCAFANPLHWSSWTLKGRDCVKVEKISPVVLIPTNIHIYLPEKVKNHYIDENPLELKRNKTHFEKKITREMSFTFSFICLSI